MYVLEYSYLLYSTLYTYVYSGMLDCVWAGERGRPGVWGGDKAYLGRYVDRYPLGCP